jgi:hypothetical protein
VTLDLTETWQPWHPSVRRGTWTTESGPVEVLAVLAPHTPSGVDRARNRAKAVLGTRAPGVLPLLAIAPHGRRIAFIYEAVEAIAIANLTGDRSVGHRAAAELVRQLATLLSDPALPTHPGPEPEDVLLCADATIRVANFVQPFPAMAPPRPPGSSGPDAALVYRLGALLAFLLGGPIPQSSTPEAHEAAVRRAQIRAMSRPGAVFSEAYGNWLRAMLAWDPIERPPLSRVIAGLDDLIATTAGPSLEETCDAHYDTWVGALQRGFVRDSDPRADAFEPEPLGDFDQPESTIEATPAAVRRTPPPEVGWDEADDLETQPSVRPPPGLEGLTPLEPADALADLAEDDPTEDSDIRQTHPTRAGRRTLGEEHVLGDLDVEDEPTVDSELGITPELENTPPSIIERGSIPVSVGPPAEVAANRPSLPAGFLGGEVTHTVSAATPTPTPASVPEPDEVWPTWMVALAIALVAIATVLGGWLLLG